ncbi:MAG: hypothetical protein QG592_1692 [Pseudomonadota bacterium]|nr:hypothetical protein [Pseudomonadota bacterium]
MSWHFSRALVEDCLRLDRLDGELCALLSWMNTADAFLSSDRMTANYDPVFQFGMTFVPLTVDRGVASFILSLEGFLAKHSALRQRAITQPMIFGRKCAESWQMSLPGTSLRRTSAEMRSTQRPTTLSRWVTKPAHFPYPRKTWVLTTFGAGTGFLHTPTTQANFCAPSMQKWSSCREWSRTFGVITPQNYEWLMGWPIGWTDLRPLETDKSRSAQQQHGECLQETCE